MIFCADLSQPQKAGTSAQKKLVFSGIFMVLCSSILHQNYKKCLCFGGKIH